jgi:hypothetical protein
MTTPPTSPAGHDPAQHNGATVSTLAGLAREVEQLRRGQAELRQLAGRVDDLACVVRQLADTVAAGKLPSPSQVAPCWLDLGTDPGPSNLTADAEDLLGRLAGWVAGIYLRYSDAKVPDCWLWHPDVVEELLWLHAAWVSAYDPDAPVTAVGDWHDRQRPGVAARIKVYAGMCSLEAHQSGQDRATPEPVAPTTDAIPAIAAWWATRRDEAGPTPTAEQMETARQWITSRRRR